MRRYSLFALACCAGLAQADLIAHWRFDEPVGSLLAMDSAGSYYGTLQGQATFVPDVGVAGGAISLHRATNDLVNMGDSLGLDGSSFTISSWVKTTDTTQTFPIARHYSGIVSGWIMAINPSGSAYGRQGRAWFYTGNHPGGEVNSDTVVNDGEWHHLCVVFVAGIEKRLYIDGAPAEGTAIANAFSPAPAVLLVGGIVVNGAPVNFFEGLIDDIQVYDRPLSEPDVQYLYDFPGVTVCGADFVRDDVLNFFDVQTFLQTFSNQQPRADMNQDGQFNFFDVQAFLAAFSAGCA